MSTKPSDLFAVCKSIVVPKMPWAISNGRITFPFGWYSRVTASEHIRRRITSASEASEISAGIVTINPTSSCDCELEGGVNQQARADLSTVIGN
jgi:hypothetical protein